MIISSSIRERETRALTCHTPGTWWQETPSPENPRPTSDPAAESPSRPRRPLRVPIFSPAYPFPLPGLQSPPFRDSPPEQWSDASEDEDEGHARSPAGRTEVGRTEAAPQQRQSFRRGAPLHFRTHPDHRGSSATTLRNAFSQVPKCQLFSENAGSLSLFEKLLQDMDGTRPPGGTLEESVPIVPRTNNPLVFYPSAVFYPALRHPCLF